LTKAWVRERKKDFYYQQAKSNDFRSRATYKLLQTIEKHELIRSGDVVVDLGAAPGGWIQASRKTVGEKGFVLGIDLKPIEPVQFSNVVTIVGDITDSQIVDRVREILPRQADVLISDVSPNVSGIWELDHARQIDLAQKSMEIAKSTLRCGGNLFMKVFQGDMLNDFVLDVRIHFSTVRLVKPKASRPKSSELYVLARGLKKPKSHNEVKSELIIPGRPSNSEQS
jgi:23S rRNA (uridine2552-2'-O)-methyltransferase